MRYKIDITVNLRKHLIQWLKLGIGSGVLWLIFLFFSSGYTPPGILGEVIRHNQKADIDASPFFYGDVENMLEIIESAELMWSENKN